MDINLIESKLDTYLGKYSKYFPIYIEKYSSDLTEFNKKIYNFLKETLHNERKCDCKPLFLCCNHRTYPELSEIVLCDTGICDFHVEKFKTYKNRTDGKLDVLLKKFVEYNNIHSIFYHKNRLGICDIWLGTKTKPGFFSDDYPSINLMSNVNDIPENRYMEFANDICNFINSINGNCKLYHD